MTVRTRIAPSPTGIAHIGTAYMALFNYAYAHKYAGEFLVRIEDTDRNRFVEGAEQVIYEALSWLSIPYQRTFRQSERLPVYQEAARQLVASGHAYYCFCTPERLATMREEQQAKKQIPRYDRICTHLSSTQVQEKLDAGMSHVIRLRMPDDRSIEWIDLIRGNVSINTKELDDQVLLKSDGFPTYHLAVVVDDHHQQITHIIRGEEWISSTPKHIVLYEAFGWQTPIFAHMPLLRNPDRTKMSKRKNDVSIPSYKEHGYLPEALRNYLCLLGWSHPEEKDIFSIQEFIQEFSMERMVKNGPIFDTTKLQWMNGKYIREHLTQEELEERLIPFLPSDFPEGLLPKVLPLVRDRLVVLQDIGELTSFFYKDIAPDPALLLGKKATREDVMLYLETAIEFFQKRVNENWNPEKLEQTMLEIVDAQSFPRGAFFMALRVALTGRSATPPLFPVIVVLGKELTLSRLGSAHTLLA